MSHDPDNPLRGFDVVFPLYDYVNNGNVSLELPELTVTAYSGVGAVNLVLPELVLSASGNDADNARALLTLPAPELTITTGAVARNTLPSPTLTASGTVPGWATVRLELPEPGLTATGLSGETASATLTLPAPTLTTRVGATASLELVAPELTATATSIGLATAHLTLPFLTLTATGISGATATVSLELPAPTLTAIATQGSIGTATLTLPALVLTANDGTLTTETTYVVNLHTGAVTEFLLGRFTKLVTAHGRLYGLRPDGELVKLDGDTDHGAAIPATIRFAPQQFATLQAKRVSDVYLNAREDDGIDLTLIQDETTRWRYRTPTDRAPALGTHKVKVGRGVTFHSLGLVVENRNGGRLDIGGMDLLVQPLSRKPR